MDFKRVLIEKKREFNVEAQNLLEISNEYLNLNTVKGIRVINQYDLIGVTDDKLNEIVEGVLYEPTIDLIYYNTIPMEDSERAFRVEYLKGQYNQRQDSTINLINNFIVEDPIDVLHSKIIIIDGISEEEIETLKSYYINSIEAKEVDLDSFHYEKELENTREVQVIDGFIHMNPEQVEAVKAKVGLGMDMDDLIYCQSYFVEENRDPTILELKLIDTYWSDHCRHTTFMTEITDVKIDEGKYKAVFEAAIKNYIESRKYVYEDRDRAISLMDLATINMKEIKKKGLLADKEETEEINAASIEIDVDVNGEIEKYLLMFKNETHNHPTEMEPFGGASTCLGGAIRDPLSGRSFVYQAMRISGSGDPRQEFADTLKGKLSQRKITTTAMEGYSSYGNQIGAATGYVKEVYDPGFVAKRMECGALVAAVPKENVYRGQAEPGDLIVLIGGRTGRDGLGGAVGSSKEHTEESLDTSGAEVQKGNPPLERKILRLFRKAEVSQMIKVCNDFGAGGVSVAIGELADGLLIQLDNVPLKYPGLDGTEIALSESQERMAVVIDEENLFAFMSHVLAEDLEGTVVATVTEEKSLKMLWEDKEIVNIKRSFLDTNGIRKQMAVQLSQPKAKSYLDTLPSYLEEKSLKDNFIENLSGLNTSSQKGLVQNFDNTVGGATVLMPYGGKYESSPAEGMVSKIPVLNGTTNTCSIMTYGYDPELSKWSPFHGGYYAVIESIARLVALGGDYKNIRLTLQEYFERLGEDETKWGKPFLSLLGAYEVQKSLDIPSIGGKDSMSGTFEEIDVPPTLISFAVAVDKVKNILSTEFKGVDNPVVLVKLSIDENGLVDLEELKKNYSMIKQLVDSNMVLAASTVKQGGIAKTISEMSFGNKIGLQLDEISKEDLFLPLFGSIVLELKDEANIKDLNYTILGKTIAEEKIRVNGEEISIHELLKSYEEPLSQVFPTVEGKLDTVDNFVYKNGSMIINKVKTDKPKVLIPIFTGTHGEYTLEAAFTRAGGHVETYVFNTQSQEFIEESYIELANKIRNCQIIALPNGSPYGNEPESGGKLLQLVFNNPLIKEAVNDHLTKDDGLMIGIGSGFTSLIKLGLIENGQISSINEPSTYIVQNHNGRFVSKMVDLELVSNLTPWVSEMELNSLYTTALATSEGRIILPNGAEKLKNGQVISRFVCENPTGSINGIEAMASPDGRVFGTITAIDRIDRDLYKNVDIKGQHKIFQSGINYFK